jgi:hypothetical protein
VGASLAFALIIVRREQHEKPALDLRGIFAHHNRVEQKIFTIIDEWCCGYVKGISLDAKGWEPLRKAQPEWLEPIELYGT